ncbi:MAG: GIY-YIG nuclease family protein [bacterium]|nr:GIY-YIG nuclease family protein [bacterium]
MYFVYIILCTDKSLYTGITTDLKRRFNEHKNKKGGAYTRAHKVEKIVYSEKLETRSKALKREAEIKNWKRQNKLYLIKH